MENQVIEELSSPGSKGDALSHFLVREDTWRQHSFQLVIWSVPRQPQKTFAPLPTKAIVRVETLGFTKNGTPNGIFRLRSRKNHFPVLKHSFSFRSLSKTDMHWQSRHTEFRLSLTHFCHCHCQQHLARSWSEWEQRITHAEAGCFHWRCNTWFEGIRQAQDIQTIQRLSAEAACSQ